MMLRTSLIATHRFNGFGLRKFGLRNRAETFRARSNALNSMETKEFRYVRHDDGAAGWRRAHACAGCDDAANRQARTRVPGHVR